MQKSPRRFLQGAKGRKVLSYLIGCVGWGISAVTWAFGLGEITVYSEASAPLRADIELLAINPDQVSKMRAGLASEQEFEWMGIPRSAVFEQLKFKPMVTPDGRPVIRVTTSRPLGKGFLDFLVEVSGPHGHLIREYTILQEPAGSGWARPAPARSAITGSGRTPSESGAIIRRLPAGGGTTPSFQGTLPDREPLATVRHRPPVETHGNDLSPEYVTHRGDSLYKIGRRYARAAGIATVPMAQAIFQSNPQAFIAGDMDRLKAGATLRIPEPEEVPRLAALGRGTSPEKPATPQEDAAPSAVRTPTPAPAPPEPEPRPAPIPRNSPEPAPAPVPRPSSEPSPTHFPQPSPSSPVPVPQPPTEPLQAAPTEASETPAEVTSPTPEAAHQALEILGNDKTALPTAGTQPDPGATRYTAQLEKTVQLAQELAESRRQENTSLKGHIDRLNTVVVKQEQLIELQNSELQQLKQRWEAAIESSPATEGMLWKVLIVILVTMNLLSLFITIRLWWTSRADRGPITPTSKGGDTHPTAP